MVGCGEQKTVALQSFCSARGNTAPQLIVQQAAAQLALRNAGHKLEKVKKAGEGKR